MYEKETQNTILNRLMNNVEDKVDKRQGSIVWDSLSPISAELAQLYIKLDYVLTQGFADTANRKYLIKRALERGIIPYDATPSIILANLVGNINLVSGERFSIDGINYSYIGEREEQYYKLKCEQKGHVGNISYGELIPISNIANLSSSSIHSILTLGKDEENTEDFRKRYFRSFQQLAFGGNRADYIEKIQKLNEKQDIINNGGIGGIKLYRVPSTIATVSIYIQSSNYDVPSQTLIDKVQEYVNPIDKNGDGAGIAPIGHFVTIYNIQSSNIPISTEIELKAGYVMADVKPIILQNIKNYIKELNKEWQNENNIILRISQIENEVLKVIGVIDVKNTKIKNISSNLNMDKNTMVSVGSDIIVT